MIDADFGNKKYSIEQRRYLGSKSKLLLFIDSILKKERVNYKSFADIFAGTGVVANFFHDRADVILNDILESNYQSYIAFFGDEHIRPEWLKKRVSFYNSLDGKRIKTNYFSRNFSNTYFDSSNTKKIGFIRQDIEDLHRSKKINKREKAYLITSLMYALDKIANTVGHYDAYRKVEIPKKNLELRTLELRNTDFKAEIYKMDANKLAESIYADVVYIDPPYNSRQYSDAYHLLENVASWEQKKVFGVAKKIDRSHLKSKYSLKSAGNAFSELIDCLNTKFILVSYNDTGTIGASRSHSRISDNEIISALERKGKVTIYEKNFKQFTTGASTNKNLKERVFFCRVEKKSNTKLLATSLKQDTFLPDYIKSPLNYTGGKYKLLPQLMNFFSKRNRHLL